MEFNDNYKALANNNQQFADLLTKVSDIISKCNDKKPIEEYTDSSKIDMRHFQLSDGLHVYEESFMGLDTKTNQPKRIYDYSISSEPQYKDGKKTFAPAIVVNSSQISLMMMGKYKLPDVIYVNNRGEITINASSKTFINMIMNSESDDYDICESLVSQGKVFNPECMKSGDLFGFVNGLKYRNEREQEVIETLRKTVSSIENNYLKEEVVETSDKKSVLKGLLDKFKRNNQAIDQISAKKEL